MGDYAIAVVVGLGLAALAAAIVAAVTFGTRLQREENARRAAHPAEPWLWREDWSARRITHEVGPVGLAFAWGFTLFWYGFLAVIGWAILSHPEPEGDRGPWIILSVFAAAGLLLLSMSVRATAHWARFRSSTFGLDAMPFAVGGWVSGVIEAPRPAAQAERFDITLDCVQVSVMRRSSTMRSTKWREEVTVEAAGLERGAFGIRIPVAIAVPADALPTTRTSGSGIEWQLSVRAALPGVDYDAAFVVPVFEVKDRTSTAPRPPSASRAAREGQGAGRPASSRIRLERLADGVALQYPTPSWFAYWTVGPILLVPAAAAIGRVAYPEDRTAGLVCLAVGMIVAGLALALTLFGVLTFPNRVEIQGDVVIVRRGLFGRGWDRRIPRRDVVAVKHVPLQNGPRVDHTVDIETRQGKSYNAALGLRDLTEAKWLAAEMERQIGVAARPPRG